MTSKTKFTAALVTTVSFLLLGLWVGLTPLKFVKLVSLRTVKDTSTLMKYDMSRVFEPDITITKIPYQKGRIVEVHPKRRYQRTILEGSGDCSNLNYGIAYKLNEEDIDYAIVHLLRVPGFLEGEGHVALQTVIEFENEISVSMVDMLEGGILRRDGSNVSLKTLQNYTSTEIEILPFHPSRDTISNYYKSKNLRKTAIGITPRSEIEQYFSFIESIYSDLGNPRLEKYLMEGLALLIDVYPKIYILESESETVIVPNRLAQSVSIVLLWLVRLTVLVSFLALLVYGGRLAIFTVRQAMRNRSETR